MHKERCREYACMMLGCKGLRVSRIPRHHVDYKNLKEKIIIKYSIHKDMGCGFLLFVLKQMCFICPRHLHKEKPQCIKDSTSSVTGHRRFLKRYFVRATPVSKDAL